MGKLSGSMSAKDCRAAADYMEREVEKLRGRENYPFIREQVDRLSDTVRILREEADEKEKKT